MTNKTWYSLVLLAAIPLQCAKDDAQPVALHLADETGKADPDVVHLSEKSREMAGIELEVAKNEKCCCTLKAMAKILAPQPKTAIVGHAFPARVAKVHVQIGDWVEPGQPLVDLESNEVGTAKSEFFKAVADLELARLNFTREEHLLENKIGVEKNYLLAEAEYKIAQSNREAMEKKLHVLGFTEEHVKEIAETHQINPTITLYAPIAGKIVASEAILGAQFDQGTPIMTVIDPKKLWVDAAVYEKDISKVKIGQKVNVSVPAYQDEVFEGVLSYIGDLVQEDTRTITVRAEVDNEQQRLKPGMFADVDIFLNGGYDAIVISKAAVLETGDTKIVYVQDDDGFRRRDVVTGPVTGDCQQIIQGLEAGEQVVVVGNHLLESQRRMTAMGHAFHAHSH
jgi:cobalt-zinc-cadmium efflux system membrane fusion protein